jgi:RNA polymerase sigma-70 factor (ECF subfamily)
MPRLFLVDNSHNRRGVPPQEGLGGPEPGGAVERAPSERDGRLRGMVDGYIDFVSRVLRNAGTPQADIDDEVQRTFIIAARRLDDVRPGSERSFLLQTALNVAAHARRTLARRREVGVELAPEALDLNANPEQLTDQKRVRQILDQILDRMSADLRTVFVLHEFEEMSMVEISEALGIPSGTVASRLRRARAEFRARVGVVAGLSKTARER